MLKASNVSYRIKEKYLVDDINLDFGEGQFTVIMGQNGAGKSTLLKILAKSLKSSKGDVECNARNIQSYHSLELAKLRAVLSQHYDITFPITVDDIVIMGRYPHFKNAPSSEDNKICGEVMKLLNIEDLKGREYNTLSGGEAQKVQMARVLAQIWEKETAKILFLDEPVSNLDMKYQNQILGIAQKISRENCIVVAVLHDINLSINYADRIVFMKDGLIKYVLSDLKELTEEIIFDVFNVKAKIITNPFTDKPLVVYEKD
ncbi:MAG: heme ABC transporter ATP-binding protein [Ignavibacteria bacterium]|nr:heme ABC transporter ATP-binding protein [Ignavibacteria bacterium]